jgi:outer membrane protein TolC
MDSGGAVEKRTRELLSRPLVADSAVELALLNNAGLQAAFEELGVARSGLVHALRLPNPTAEGTLRFHADSRPEIGARVLEDLSELFLLPLRSGVASAQLDAAKMSVAGSVLDVAFEAQAAFYGYQSTLQLLELRRTVLQATRASFEAAQRLHDAGNIPDLSLANERALYDESRLLHARAETASLASHERLGALLGLSGREAQWTAVPQLPDIPANELPTGTLERRAIEQSLDLAFVRHRFEAAAKRANFSRARGWLPELAVGVEAEREEHWAVGPAAAVSIPLFYQGQGEVGAALAEMRRQRKMYGDVAVRIRAAARAGGAQLATARESAVYFKKVLLPLREQIVQDTQLEYNAMSVGVFQLLQSKRDQIEVARAYVEGLRDYWLTRSEVEELLAGRLARGSLSPEEVVRESTPLERGRGGLEQH